MEKCAVVKSGIGEMVVRFGVGCRCEILGVTSVAIEVAGIIQDV
jgi:hypothetical protein